MAAFDHFSNMYDLSLKARMLRTMIREQLPDEKHPTRNPSDLSHVVYVIKTYKLLSESSGKDQKQTDNWKSAVDLWVERLLMIISSNMPDKCWAGICLLGVTCQECSSDRFLASYSIWFNKLFSHIQPPADSQFVKVACIASISDLFTRLAGFPNLKKDGTSHAGRLIQAVLKLLNEDGSDAVGEAAVLLLCTIISFFPSSINRHYDSAETAIASKIMSGKCSDNMLKKLAHCLALLPKSRGDQDSWSILMQKILYMINAYLNDAFQGVEEETKRDEVVRLLVPPGKDPPLPLGGHTLGEATDKAKERSKQLPISSVSTLMLCCCTMLTSSYPVQVTVPVRPLLALIERILMMDGSLPHALLPFMTVMQQEIICAKLPILHSHGLELLTAVIKGMRRQLLPHAAYIVRLVMEYFKRCALPELRIKVYSITRILLMSMGVGIAVYLAQEVINCASNDLDPSGDEDGSTSSTTNLTVSTNVLLQPYHRKRKHASTTGSLEEPHGRTNLEVETQKNHSETPISLKIAALEALEALLTVGGAFRSERWRPNVDLLIVTVATNSCKGGWATEERNIFLPNEPTSIWADFQLAAFRALLASLLSLARMRPPYLAQGLELFRRGKQETGTKLAEFCAHALLALEVLIHPRALPLVDFHSANSDSFDGVNHRYPENIYYGGQKQNTTFSSGIQRMEREVPDSDDDELFGRWRGNADESDAPVSDPGKNVKYSEEPFKTFGANSAEKPPVDGSDAEVLSAHVGMKTNVNENMVESEQIQESIMQFQEPASSRAVADTTMVELEQIQESVMQSQEPASSSRAVADTDIVGGSKSTEIKSSRVVSETDSLGHAHSGMASGDDVLAAKNDVFPTGDISTFASLLKAKKNKESMPELDDDSSIDSFPDIVDADPDSD